jgi:hypothetical protein
MMTQLKAELDQLNLTDIRTYFGQKRMTSQ